ncbi:unnamed protein product [Rhizophagus irregularis]|nr:unnamed protein product [Rhizophagus irregularis]
MFRKSICSNNQRSYVDNEDVMATTRNDENEEISEDELESEYERIMMEFNENDEDEMKEEGDSDEEVIIDQPDEEVIVINLLVANNFIFLWLINENITITYGNSSPATQAYDELVDIIRNPQFRKEDVVPNSRRFRKYRQRLPLLPIRSRKINISNMKTPSTSKNIGEAYYLSITDIIRNILNNPLLFSNMYFGPGQEVTKNKELWHGDIWKESARFGKTSITIAQHVYYSGDFVVYRESSDAKRFGRILAIVQKDDRLIIKIQRIIRFEELPGNLQSNNRKERSQDNEVWFLDREMEDAVMNVELHAIVSHAPITIHYDNSNNRHSIKIREILYKHNGR